MSPGLYVHVPFCSAICPYCDFAVAVGGEEKRRAYVDSLKVEIALAATFPGPFDTIYFGGGTPSLLFPEPLAEILEALQETFTLASERHLFLEANPEDVNTQSLEAWRRLGFTTLSLGIQSFADEELGFLGRRHTSCEARRAVELALGAGFETVSIDLIYGLPGQSLDDWQSNLRTAVELSPQHLSCYELEVHEKTTFGKRKARGELRELDEDVQADLFIETHRLLGAAGFPGYEVSNFACDPRHHSGHNRKYWDHTPYLGLGPGAHSFDGTRRFWNERSVARYMRLLREGKRPRSDEEVLTAKERALEALMLALRTYDGIDLERFEALYGIDLYESHRERIESFVDDGLLELTPNRLRPTLRGLSVADRLAVSLGP